ncbi:MAG: MFS transporter [Clostridia bacterium]|nr:MFS transporter [Clostridia bacterium]
MTKYLEDKRASLILIVVCFITYTIIGLTRNAYSAAIADIINEGYFSKADAGIIATSFNITYCISQIIGSYYVDKVSPFKIILLGTIVTIFANIVMSLNPTYWVIFISRGICGIAQFGIWPSLLRVVSEYVNEDHRYAWGYILPLGVPLGSVLSYLCAALISEWRGLFTLSYIAMAVATIVFIIAVTYAQKKAVTGAVRTKTSEDIENTQNRESIGVFKLLTTSGALFLMIPIFTRGLINGGIANWMPTMIMESYNTSPAISNIMTTISTCANLIAVMWVIILYPRVFKLQTMAVGMLLLFMLPFLTASVFIGSIPIILVVIFIAVINTFNGSIHQFNTVEIPKAYTKYNRAGMIAGIINAVVTFATVISGWLWGWMAETYSWNVIIAIWVVMTLIAAVCCFAITPLWKRFVNSSEL